MAGCPATALLHQFGEGSREPISSVAVHAELVVATVEVLDERMSGTDHPYRAQPIPEGLKASALNVIRPVGSPCQEGGWPSGPHLTIGPADAAGKLVDG